MINNIFYLLFPINKENRIKRNLGIDILRIISTIFIINHHIIGHGACLRLVKKFNFKNSLILFLNTIFCSGANIFGIISGFVGFRSHNYSNLILYLNYSSSFISEGHKYFAWR